MVQLGTRTTWTRQTRVAALVSVWLLVLCFVSLWLAAGEVTSIPSYVKTTGEGIASQFAAAKCDNASEVAEIERLAADATSLRAAAEQAKADSARLTTWNGGPLCSQPIVDALAALDNKWGSIGLDMSVAHWGTGARVRRAVSKLLKGEEFTIGVMGGSLTYGHGLPEGGSPWPLLVEAGLKKVFPAAKVKVVNGAIPATGTDYFQACYQHHVPGSSDIFVLEGAVNDLIIEDKGEGGGLSVDTTIHTEHLVRDILGKRPDNAVIMFSAFASSREWFNGADKHSTVAAFYDVPRITMRTFLYQYILQNEGSQFDFYGTADREHPNQAGQEYMADIFLHYLLREACRAETLTSVHDTALLDGKKYPGLSGTALKGHFDPFALPRIRVHDSIYAVQAPEVHSYCRSANVRDAADRPALYPSAKTGDWDQVGWSDKHFWSSSTPGERITFSDIPVSEGTLSIFYLRGPHEGSMLCWYDDNRTHAQQVIGYWDYVNVGSIGVVATGLPAKNYSLTCEIDKETKAEGNETVAHIIAVMTRGGDSGVDADGSIRFDRSVLRDFAGERLSVGRTVVDDVLAKIAPSTQLGNNRLSAGQVHAVFRLLSHRRNGVLDPELVFVPAEPLPLDPEKEVPAPPRRSSVRVSSAPSTATTPTGWPDKASKRPSLPPRPRSPSSSPPASPPIDARPRKSLPMGNSLDPFRDIPSPSNSPAKSRAYSASAAVGSNNPFRASIVAAADVAVDPLETISAPPTASTSSAPRPPLPPRKPSVRRPGSALPPRVPSLSKSKTRPTRADSTSSSFSDASRNEPTSTSQPSDLMQQSLAAAQASASVRQRRGKEEAVLQVIRSSAIERPQPPPPAGRRDIIDTVNRAVRESQVDPPPPPPQRVPSASSRVKPPVAPRPSPTPVPLSAAFNTVAEGYKAKYPGLRTWSPVGLLADRPGRTNYAMIILNQQITRRDTLYRAWAASTVRLCADGGANRLYDALDAEERAIMLPTMIKGDLDSLRSDVRAYYSSKGVAIKRDPSEYATDLMKCMEEVEAIEKASGKQFALLFYGGFSGRLDQTVHTMSVLLKLREKRRETYVISEDSLAWVTDTGAHLIDIDHATMGQTCGILPIGVEDAFVRTEGLKWNLNWVTSIGGELSTSNHLLPSEPAVFLETTAPVFWTVEIQPNLAIPLLKSPLSPADEVARGVKDLGMGIARAAGEVRKDFGRRLSTRQVPSHAAAPNGVGQLGDRERERGERAGLVRNSDDEYAERERDVDGYAQLD
ncbi:thiamine pyrophosphokinase 1 [Vanrija pseudolonga]|uniref:Thiamine pyrophosphokinase 1 n=1 Tax=Vanrija pseudolonga TaxID=143232 RepID=A0AAF0Y279_9TREE|nr:thiamine pyrophosphokinase 1 [Vanrija pseudolonga]